MTYQLSQVLSLQSINDTTCQMKLITQGKPSTIKVNGSFNDVLEDIKKKIENKEYSGYNFLSYSSYHRIQLLRESDSTAYALLCPFCGFLKKVYHSNSCSCRATKPFEGKLKNNSISKQVITIFKSDNLPIDNSLLKFNKFGEKVFEGTVKNIEIVENNYGFILKGNLVYHDQNIPVYADIEKNETLEEKRYFWYPC